MIYVLDILILGLMIWYFKKITREPSYACIFEKTIHIPENKRAEKPLGGLFFKTVELRRHIELPFFPQAGIVVSDFFEIPNLNPKDDGYGEGTPFSVKIEEVRWRRDLLPICKTQDFIIKEDDEIAPIIIRFLLEGWQFSSSQDYAKEEVRKYIEAWESGTQEKDMEFISKVKYLMGLS